MTLSPCPRCNELPTVQFKKRIIGAECVVHCNHIGCKLYWPIVTTGRNEQAAMQKAAVLWEQAVAEQGRGDANV